MVPFAHLNKPAHQATVDLINRCLIKQFTYGQVKITPTAGLFNSTQCMTLAPENVPADYRQAASMLVSVEGYNNALFCNYHKLKVAKCLPDAFVVGDLLLTDDELLTQLRERYGVYLTSEDVTIFRFQAPKEGTDNEYQWKLRINAMHLVWSGDWMVDLLPADHLRVELPEDALNSTDPHDEPGPALAVTTDDYPDEPLPGVVGPSQ